MEKRLHKIILECQALQEKHGLLYEEKCSKLLNKFSREIIDNNLLAKCNAEEIDFAKQLIIKNCLEYELVKCYELDFGDTNLITPNTKDVFDWIDTEMLDLTEGEELNYTITIKFMTDREYKELPEWA